MMQKLADALGYISEKHVAEAAGDKRRHRRVWLSAIAAALALVILFSLYSMPMAISAKAVSTASESRLGERPKSGSDEFFAWYDQREQLNELAEDAAEELRPFFQTSAALYMSGSEENMVWSPVNACIALSMLAEVTEGDSRQQLLDALNADGLDTLRTNVEAIWESIYKDDGNEICLLANSLWLDEDLTYSQEAMDDLAYYYYTSVYQTDLGSASAGRALRAWLSNNTGKLLKTDSVSFPAEAVLTLASTVYLQSKWASQFSAGNNTSGVFHAPGGDRDVTYMNKEEYETIYYWGSDFGGVCLSLKNGTRMWFFLPDEDKTVDDILSGEEYLEYMAGYYGENGKYMYVNLSVPKFDISSSGDLREMLEAMGITDIFQLGSADFTAITADSPVYVTGVNQSARIIIDEEGVKAASYIEIPGAGAAAPPEETIDFILDRPFLFVIADSSGIPIFTGVVNAP